MTMKKKRRRKKAKIAPRGFFIAVFIAGCMIASGVLLYYLSPLLSRVSTPDDEETSARSANFNRKISKIDHAIYESLYNGGVKEKDIFFSEVTAMNAKDYGWDFTELSVKTSDQNTASRLGKIIDKELLKLKPAVGITRENIPGSAIVYNVSFHGMHTHRIKLIFEKTWMQTYKDLPKIAIIIDDIGNDYELALSFMDIGLPLTLSILPSSPYGKAIAEMAREKGFEVILHLPMEPKNYPDINPGPDALLTKMDESEIKMVIDRALKKVPGVSGVNNHMGSYFTERADKMTYVLKDLKKRNLFFLDSRTTADSIGFKLAGEMGVPSAKKDVFLDDDLSSRAVKYQIERLIGKARYSGEAVGIGHPHKITLDVLKDYEGVLKTKYRLVPVSDLMK
jgi:uncharacterized protein